MILRTDDLKGNKDDGTKPVLERVREAPVADFSHPTLNTKVNHHTLVPRGRGAQSGQRVYNQFHGETLRRECDLEGGGETAVRSLTLGIESPPLDTFI